ncbi:MAG: hypothetical protein NPIRA02_32320 [Nitrospirales bacterium]|nr:MAG: hypothetical protein NPIRA02_32320 [Nitrospirales bacterium]
MPKVLVTISWEKGVPTLKDVCKKYGLKLEEIDQEYGIIEIDPQDNLYSILVDHEAAQRINPQFTQDDTGIKGPFSNPPIEPFGPPQ